MISQLRILNLFEEQNYLYLKLMNIKFKINICLYIICPLQLTY